jgi:hypothetical protein
MVMRAHKITLLLCVLALLPVLAFASDGCECACAAAQDTAAVQVSSESLSSRIDALRSYCENDSNDRVYGAIAYEMRFMDQAGRKDFDQRMRFAVHYFSQLSDSMSVNVGISDYVGYLPHMDPFGFQQENARRQQDLRLDTAYLKVSDEHDLSGVNSHLFK